MKKDIGLLHLIGGAIFGVISYNALAVTHYDLDPISVLASLLNISIPTLGYISGGVSIVLLLLGAVFWFAPDRSGD